MSEIVMGNVAHYKKIIEEQKALIARLQQQLIDARQDLGYHEDNDTRHISPNDWVTFGG